MSYPRGNTTKRGYGSTHQKRRKAWAPKVDAGQVACGHCGRIIVPGTPWDLSHPGDDKNLSPIPWHAKCNRSYAMTVTRKRLYVQDQMFESPVRNASRVW